MSGTQWDANPSITRPAKQIHRQRRSAEEKQRIVEETLALGSSVTGVARAHGVRPNQVFKWRRLYRDGLLNAVASETALLPVQIAESNERVVLHSADYSRSAGTIQIELAKARVRIEGNADAAMVLCWSAWCDDGAASGSADLDCGGSD